MSTQISRLLALVTAATAPVLACACTPTTSQDGWVVESVYTEGRGPGAQHTAGCVPLDQYHGPEGPQSMARWREVQITAAREQTLDSGDPCPDGVVLVELSEDDGA